MRIHFYATFREIVGRKHIDLEIADGMTVRQLLDRVLLEHPGLRDKMLDAEGQLSPYVHIFVNGRGARFLDQGLATPLSTRGDRIDFFPAVAGG